MIFGDLLKKNNLTAARWRTDGFFSHPLSLLQKLRTGVLPDFRRGWGYSHFEARLQKRHGSSTVVIQSHKVFQICINVFFFQIRGKEEVEEQVSQMYCFDIQYRAPSVP